MKRKNKETQQRREAKEEKNTTDLVDVLVVWKEASKMNASERKKQETTKIQNIDEEKTCNLIFWCCSFHERKAKKKKKNKEPKENKNKDKKEEKKKKKKRQRKRNTKIGRPKKAKGERKKNTENKQEMPFFRGKTRFFCIKQPKNQQKKTTKTTKTNKEGLGPSEVALRATSPDP